MDDPFVLSYEAADLKIAAEFLTNWIPFLTRDLCGHCSQTLTARIRSLDPENGATEGAEEDGASEGEAVVSASPKARISWADMAQEDELEEDEGEGDGVEGLREGERSKGKGKEKKAELSREQRERIRFLNVGRKKDFICLERVKGKIHNILDGLELHTGVFSSKEQNRIVDFIYELQKKGKNGKLGEHTYSEPTKWMRGKGRVTIQFGCSYNYAMDKEGNPPGILQNVVADPLPPLLKMIVKRLVGWHVLPPTCIPDSCIINIYEPGDCIPPHIDSHDFVRPFCTVSFVSECSIVFGSNLKIVGPGEFSGSAAIPLPVGSVLIFNGNGADLVKHCVPAVPTKRISITFRKMDDNKRPSSFKPEPDLQDIQPLSYCLEEDLESIPYMDTNRKHLLESKILERVKEYVGRPSVSKPDPDLQEKQVHEHGMGKSTKKSSHRRVSSQPVRGTSDFAGAEGSAGRPSQHRPYSNSPGILSSPRDDMRPSFLENPKAQTSPKMRVVCMDDRRIVVRGHFEEEEKSLHNNPHLEPSWSSRPRPINPRRR